MRFLKNWFRQLFATRRPTSQPRTFRPSLESFEERVVPTTTLVANPLANAQTKATVHIFSYWDTNRNGRLDPPVYDAARNWIGGDRGEQGTGAMISPNDVLTAGHVIFKNASHGNLGRANWTHVFAAQDGEYNRPFGVANGIAWYTPSAWQQNNGKVDMGIIRLDRNLGTHTGTFHYGWLDPNFFQKGLPVTVLHYPATNHSGFEQYRSTGTTRTAPAGTGDPNQLIYYSHADIATEGGSSGAPVYAQNVRVIGGTWGNVPTIVGVHARGWFGAGGRLNEATRITPTLFAWIQNVLNQGTNPVDRADLMDYDFFFQKQTSRLSATRVQRGGNLTVTAALWNGGTASPGAAVTIRFYASRDRAIGSPDDVLLDTLVLQPNDPRFQQLKPFNQQRPALLARTMKVPTNLAPGNYFIGWVIDPGRALQDYDRSNNIGLFNGGTLTVV